MHFCETNRIANHTFIRASNLFIACYDGGDGFMNPVRLDPDCDVGQLQDSGWLLLRARHLPTVSIHGWGRVSSSEDKGGQTQEPGSD